MQRTKREERSKKNWEEMPIANRGQVGKIYLPKKREERPRGGRNKGRADPKKHTFGGKRKREKRWPLLREKKGRGWAKD